MMIIVPSRPQIQIDQSITLTAKLADAGGNPITDVVATFTTSTPGLVVVEGNAALGVAQGLAKILRFVGSVHGVDHNSGCPRGA